MDFSLPGLLDPFASIATSQGAGAWVYLGISIIVYTLVGGIILVILLKVLSSLWGESYDMGKAFLVSLIINIISLPLVAVLIQPYVSFLPSIVFSVIIWIVIIRLFFREMGWVHVLITSIIGYVLSLIVAPIISGYIIGMISAILPI